MRLSVITLVFLLSLSFSAGLAAADSVYSEIPFSTMLQLTADGSAIQARASYLDFSYYSAPKLQNIPQTQQELYKPGDFSEDFQSAQLQPLANAPLYFTFEGQKVSSGGTANPACDPLTTDANGEAVCQATHYIDASGNVQRIEDRTGCGTLQAEFRGMKSGANDYKPSLQTLMLCPKKSAPLSAFGTAIYAALSKPSNMAVCFPALLIAGLLVASMYYSGRDPLSLFDITTPRLPRGKPFRVSAGGLTMSIQTAVQKYEAGMKMSRKAALLATKKLAAKGYEQTDAQKRQGKSKRQWIAEAEKDMKKLFTKLQNELKAKPGISDFQMDAYQKELHEIYKKYGPTLKARLGAKSLSDREKNAINRLYGAYNELGSNVLNMYLFMHQSYKLMGEARSSGGNPWQRMVLTPLYTRLKKLTIAGETGLEKAASKVPLARPLLRVAPGAGWLGFPGKVLNVARGRMAARRGARILYRLLIGQIIYQNLFTTKEGGEKKAFYAFKKLFKTGEKTKEGKEERTMLGRFVHWYGAWDPDAAFERHNIIRKQITPLFNVAEKTRLDSAEMLNTMLALRAGDLAQQKESLEEHLKEIRKQAKNRKIVLDELKKIEKGISEAENEKDMRTALRSNLPDLIYVVNSIKSVRSEEKERLEHAKRALRGYHALTEIAGTDDYVKKVRFYLDGLLDPAHKDYKKLVGERESLYKEYLKIQDDAKKAFILRVHDKHMEAIQWNDVLNITDALKNFWAERKAEAERKAAKAKGMKSTITPFEVLRQTEKNDTLKSEMNRFVSTNLQQARIDGTCEGKKIIYEGKKIDGLGKETAELLLLKGMRTKDDFERITMKNALPEVEREFKEKRGLAPDKPSIIKRIEQLNEKLANFAVKAGAIRPEEKIVAFKDPLGQSFSAQFRKLIGALGPDFEKTLEEFAGKELGDRKAFLRRVAKGEFQNMNEVEVFFAKSGTAPKFRQALLEAFPKNEAGVEGFYKALGYGKQSLSLAKALLKDLEKAPDEQARSKLLAGAVLDLLLEQTAKAHTKWSAATAMGRRLAYGDEASWKGIGGLERADVEKYIRGKVAPAEQFDYNALRHELRLSEGYGQFTETALSLLRAQNRMMDWVLWEGRRGATWVGSTLYAYRENRDFCMTAYGTEASMYQRLTDKKSRLYDKTWVEEEMQKKNKVTLNSEDFNAEAYYQLQKRGLLFHDYNKGLPYQLSAADSGAIPLADYQIEGGKPRTKIYAGKKGEEENLMPLLARIMSSPYAENQFGVVLMQQDRHDKWKRRDIISDPQSGRLYGIAQATHNLRAEFADAIAKAQREQGGLKWRAISANDYVANYMAKPRKWLVEKPGQMLGHILYGAFYEQAHKMNEWYVGQATARFALNQIPMLAERVMVEGKDQLAVGDYLANPKKVPTSKGLFSAKYGLSEAKLEQVSLEAKNISSHEFGREFRRSIRRKEFGEIADFESEAYARQTELRALKKLGYLKPAMQEGLENEIKELNSIHKELKSEFKEFRNIMIELTGSGHGGDIYGSRRNIFTTWAALTPWFDSRFEQGFFKDFYNAVESSTMRSTITSFGGQQGLEYAYYMGYETGQGMYERGRFWATGALWEQQMVPFINVTQTAHKFFAPFASSYYRHQASMPSYLQKSEMQPGDSAAGYRQSPAMLFGLHAGTTDFFRARVQNFLEYSGFAAVLGAFQKTGKAGAERDFVRKWLDSRIIPSEHFYSFAQIWGEQRYKDKAEQLDRMLEKDRDAIDALEKAGKRHDELVMEGKVEEARRQSELINSLEKNLIVANKEGRFEAVMNSEGKLEGGDRTLSQLFDKFQEAAGSGEQEEAKKWAHKLEPYIPQFIDARPGQQKHGVVGEMFFSDGSKDRFMNLYMGFHTNIWKPIVPGMVDLNPLTGQYLPFTQIAAVVERAGEGTRLASMKSYQAYEFNESTGKLVLEEKFSTHKEAYRDVYSRTEPALLHLMREQRYFMQYELGNPLRRVPAYWILPPVWINAVVAWKHRRDFAIPPSGDEKLNELVLKNTGMNISDWQYGANLAGVRWEEEKMKEFEPGYQKPWYEKTWGVKWAHRIVAAKMERSKWQWEQTKSLLDATWAASLAGKKKEEMSSWEYNNLEVLARLYKLQKGGAATFFEAPE